MNGIIMTAQLLLGLSLLIILHELGHFLAARAFGIKVEKFYLFFDAWGFKIFSLKKGDVEYGIGWLPLGGYVKIAGMIDERTDTDQIFQAPKSWEFRSKPVWQRLIVMFGGIIVNIIVGIFIFWMITFRIGESFTPNSALVNGIWVSNSAASIGLKNGDKIVEINDKKIVRFEELRTLDVLGGNTTFTVLRKGQAIKIKVPYDLLNKVIASKKPFIRPRYTTRIGGFDNGIKTSIKVGDQIKSVDGIQVNFMDEINAIIQKKKGQNIQLVMNRNGHIFNDNLHVDITGSLNLYPNYEEIKHENIRYGFFQALPIGVNLAGHTFTDNASSITKMVTNRLSPRHISSPIGIAKLYGGEFDWCKFWLLTGIISISLAFMNLLPIPGLDGGHIAFILVEMAQGKRVSEKFFERAQIIGLILLICLMAFSFGNDIFKSFGV